MSAETFTPGEERLLGHFVTSTSSPVFCLVNLPETVKGALFSRYSRSTKGLRRLLLDEFLTNPEGGFAGEAAAAGDAIRQMLNVARAQEFYDRILDGYGDDSIGELGGAHLALERVSNIASKAVEDCRIGGSPLEKSTRYVRFDQKVDGQYQYYREPRIMASRHASAYIETMDVLFSTYSRLVEPMQAFVRERFPQEEGISKAAYDSSVRSMALDCLRGLLPAATLTNVGLFGNGRFFESLLVKLRTSPLAELGSLADLSQAELDKVIPSFVRRARRDSHHFASQEAFHAARSAAVRDAALSALKGLHDTPDMHSRQHERSVSLVRWDRDAEERVLAAILYPEHQVPLAALADKVRSLPGGERDRILAAYLSGRGNRRHKPGRALEHASYTFDILADFGCYRDLQRHRMLTQERQLLSTAHGCNVPGHVDDAGFGREYREALDLADAFCREIAGEMPLEAQYAVPFAYRLRWYVTINLRSLVWLCELRTVPQGHESYRRVAQEIFREVERVHPRLAACFGFVDMNQYALGRLTSEMRAEERKLSRWMR